MDYSLPLTPSSFTAAAGRPLSSQDPPRAHPMTSGNGQGLGGGGRIGLGAGALTNAPGYGTARFAAPPSAASADERQSRHTGAQRGALSSFDTGIRGKTSVNDSTHNTTNETETRLTEPTYVTEDEALRYDGYYSTPKPHATASRGSRGRGALSFVEWHGTAKRYGQSGQAPLPGVADCSAGIDGSFTSTSKARSTGTMPSSPAGVRDQQVGPPGSGEYLWTTRSGVVDSDRESTYSSDVDNAADQPRGSLKSSGRRVTADRVACLGPPVGRRPCRMPGSCVACRRSTADAGHDAPPAMVKRDAERSSK